MAVVIEVGERHLPLCRGHVTTEQAVHLGGIESLGARGADGLEQLVGHRAADGIAEDEGSRSAAVLPHRPCCFQMMNVDQGRTIGEGEDDRQSQHLSRVSSNDRAKEPAGFIVGHLVIQLGPSPLCVWRATE
jgi:hypothetical protein